MILLLVDGCTCYDYTYYGPVPLKILSIEDGTVLQRFNHLLHRTKKIEFIEQFSEKLLVKQACAIVRLDIVGEAGMCM